MLIGFPQDSTFNNECPLKVEMPFIMVIWSFVTLGLSFRLFESGPNPSMYMRNSGQPVSSHLAECIVTYTAFRLSKEQDSREFKLFLILGAVTSSDESCEKKLDSYA